jgi:hypothetical protein
MFEKEISEVEKEHLDFLELNILKFKDFRLKSIKLNSVPNLLGGVQLNHRR